MFNLEHQIKQQLLRAEEKYFSKLNEILKGIKHMDQALTDLQTQVSRLSTDIQNAIAKLTGVLPPNAVADADVQVQVAALAKAADALEAAVNPPVTPPVV